jgi:hypothetical protein
MYPDLCSGKTTVDPFDPERLRWTPPKVRRRKIRGQGPRGRKLPKPGTGEAYLTGPIPMSWIEEATRLSGRTWQVASALWFVGVRSKSKSATVTLTEKTRRRFHLTRNAINRGLKQLAKAGLVIVERQVGTYSVVTILPSPRSAGGRPADP